MISIFTDGGSRGNPGPAACAYVVYDSSGILREKCGKYLSIATNNEAEYQGVIEALSYLSNLSDVGNLEINFFLDSLLVVNQLNGLWKVKDSRMREYLTKIRLLESEIIHRSPLTAIRYNHIPREKNQAADALVNETLDNAH